MKRRLALAEANLQDGPEREIGKEYEYSNLGYMLAGCFLERVGEGTWEELIAKDVFAPLGMTSAGFGPPNTKDEEDQPWGHVILGGIALPPMTIPRRSARRDAHLTTRTDRFALQFADAAAADTGATRSSAPAPGASWRPAPIATRAAGASSGPARSFALGVEHDVVRHRAFFEDGRLFRHCQPPAVARTSSLAG